MTDPAGTVPVKPHIAERAHIGSLEEYQELYRRSIEDPDGFWAEQAEALDWFHPWHTVQDSRYDDVNIGWYLGGKLNACFNCVDRHVEERPDDTAILWAADEPGEYRRISYHELQGEVCRIANVLQAHGVRKGDRVCLYMPMIPELAYTMLACAGSARCTASCSAGSAPTPSVIGSSTHGAGWW